MPPYSVRFSFSQRFSVPASAAYKWCTNYEPDDLALMGEKDGRRKVRRISEDAFILTDTYVNDGRRTIKRKLVRLDPSRLSWTSTHLASPIKYSQFLYVITSIDKSSSRLDFTGLQVNYDDENSTRASRASLAKKLKKEDSGAWRLLAEAMESDLKHR